MITRRIALFAAGAIWLNACGPKPNPTPPDAGGPTTQWEVVFENLPGALLSVTGTSSSDVYAVGADARDGKGALFLHFDGTAWKRIATPVTGDLWWVQKVGAKYFLSGTKGALLTFDPATGTATALKTPLDNVTLYGVWGATDTDVWVVGGNTEKSGPPTALWHYDGTEVKAVTAPSPIDGKSTLFKVFGLSAKDVWVCGSEQSLLHWDGAAWSVLSSGGDASLFTVHGTAGLQVAVGGFGESVVLERTGAGDFKQVSVSGQRMNGVFASSDTDAIAVGVNGDVLRRSSAGWKHEDQQAGSYDLHAVWVDEKGAPWAVGGDLSSVPLRRGTLVHFTDAPIGKSELPQN